MKNIFSLLLIALTVSTAGCGVFEEKDAEHRPGENCNECHGFTYAGTIYSDKAGSSAVNNATITILQTDGRELVLKSNAAGNFFTSVGTPSLGYDVTATYGTGTRGKSKLVTNGGCNLSQCHTPSGQGRVYVN